MNGTVETGGGLRFAGYAAIFGRVDKGGDVIAPGAFAASLTRRAGAALPLLWQHAPGQRIGTIDLAREDARGLRVIGRIEGAGATARKAAASTLAGAKPVACS